MWASGFSCARSGLWHHVELPHGPRPHHRQDGRTEDPRHGQDRRFRGPLQGAQKADRRADRPAAQAPANRRDLRSGRHQGRQAVHRDGVRRGTGPQHADQQPRSDSRRQAALLFRQMAEAIEAVHKAGFIHRDVCPRNFIVAPDATDAQADRLRPDAPQEARIHAPRQPHRHAAVHGPGDRPPQADRPAGRSVLAGRFGLSDVDVRLSLAVERHDRPRRLAARQHGPDTDQEKCRDINRTSPRRSCSASPPIPTTARKRPRRCSSC